MGLVAAKAMMELNGLIMLAGDAQKFCHDWFVPSLFVALLGLLFWFIRTKFLDLGKSDDRIEGKIDKNFSYILKETKSIGQRVARIEGHLDLGALTAGSPITLTAVGVEILKKSGIQEATDKNKDKLLDAIKAEKPGTAYDVQEVTRRVFQAFDFGLEIISQFKNYCFQSGKWGLSDVLDVGAVYFRDIALPELGFKLEDLEKNKPK